MSIKTEIDRIKQSKADIISALTTKGVTVPSDASIDDLSALVDAIEVASDPVLQSKTVSPTTSKQTIKPDSGYDGLSQVTISAVTSSIDSDIKASNIKSGVNILGVTGTLESGITPTGTMSITSNGTYDVTNYASANVNVSGGGSGGSVETGTLTISVNDTSMDGYTVMYTDENGTIQQDKNSPTSIKCALNTLVSVGVVRASAPSSKKASGTNIAFSSMEVFDIAMSSVYGSYSLNCVCYLKSNTGSVTINVS